MPTYANTPFDQISDGLPAGRTGNLEPDNRPPNRTASIEAVQDEADLRPPTVLIVTDCGNEQFDQLACTLRRRGVRVVRICNPPESQTMHGGPKARTRWLRDRLFYDACLTLAPGGGGVPLNARALRGVRILDVLANEPTLSAAGLSGCALSDLAARGLAYIHLPPSVLLDKFALNAVLHENGIRIPAQLAASQVTPSEAVRRLGLPLLIKDHVGAGGEGVRLGATLQEVELATQELARRNTGSLFYQQHIAGEMVMYGVVIGDQGVMIEHGLKVTSAQWALGPSARVAVFDDPDLLATGRAVAAVLGCRGFAEIGFLRDQEARLWHIDANCRSWGNMISLLAVGIDFTAAYVSLLTSSPWPAGVAEMLSVEADVLPFSLYAAIKTAGRREMTGACLAFIDVCRRGPGWRYGSIVLTKAAILLAARGARELRRGLHLFHPGAKRSG